MACRGVHFALTEEQYKKVCRSGSDDELIELIQEDIEEEWDTEWLREADKAWDAIHRCLTDGKLEWKNGSFPLNAVVVGGKQVSLVTPDQIPSVADALEHIDKTALKKGYDQIKQKDYDGEIGEEDFEYTWEWFKDLYTLYEKAAQNGRAVLFSVDQ